MIRVIDRLVGIFSQGAVAAGVLMFAFVFSSAMMRYLFGSPIYFSDELVGLLFLSLTFLGMPAALATGRHIRITILLERYPAPLRKALEVLSLLVVVAFAAIFGLLAWRFTEFSHEIGARSEVARLPLSPWMLVMPVCMAMLIAAAVSALCRVLRRPPGGSSPGGRPPGSEPLGSIGAAD